MQIPCKMYAFLFLAFTDLLVGSIAMPLTTEKLHLNDINLFSSNNGTSTYSLAWHHNEKVCIIWLLADMVACTASIWNLAAIALDRLTVSKDCRFQ